jgi:hypothetical protein
MKITKKDWDRMLDLILTDNEGETVARSIKDPNKAAARFICGLKLMGLDIDYRSTWNDPVYVEEFSCFGNRAIELGGPDFIVHILNEFRKTEIPLHIRERRAKYIGKKMNNGYVSFISKAIIDAGFDINYLGNGGNAITSIGRDAMSRSGLKWTIGYRAEVIVGEEKHSLIFDAITCEAGGPTSYVLSDSSSNIFGNIRGWYGIGKLAFKAGILDALKAA